MPAPGSLKRTAACGDNPVRAFVRAGVSTQGNSQRQAGCSPTSWRVLRRAPISPLLANVALHVLDEEWSARHSGLGVVVRYCDDLVVVCVSRARAEEARSGLAAIVAPLGLQLNPDKTRIVCLTEGREGFDFLGFHHHKRRSRRRPGVWYLASLPSARAMRSVRARVREATGRRNVGRPVEAVVVELNRVLRGWGNFFRWGNPAKKLWNIDCYVYEHLERFLRAKHGPCFGRRRMYDIYPPLGVYRLTRPARVRPAHA